MSAIGPNELCLTSKQRQDIEEFRKSILKAQKYNNWKHEKALRSSYIDYIRSNGITDADLFRFYKGKDPCCEGYKAKVIKPKSSYRCADNTLHNSPQISWCTSCGALHVGNSITKPRDAV